MLDRLPTELLSLVLSHLYPDDYTTRCRALDSCCLLSKFVLAVAQPQLWRDIRVSRFTQLPSIEAGSGEENRGRSTLCFTWTGSRSGRRMGSGLQASLLRALSKMSNLYSLAISHACLRVTAFDCAGLTFPSLTCLSLLNVQVSGAAATEIFQPRKLAQLKALSLVDRFWEEQNTKPRQRHVNGPMEWAFLPPLPRFLLDHLDVLQLALADGGLIPKKYLVDPRPPTRWLVRGDAVKIRKHVCQVKPTHLSLEGGWEPFSKYTWREEDIADRAWRLRDLLNAITDNRLQPTSIRSIAFPSLLNLKANRAGGMGEAAIADIIEACKERGIKVRAWEDVRKNEGAPLIDDELWKWGRAMMAKESKSVMGAGAQ